MTQHDSSLIPSDAEHDRHYIGEQNRCGHCCCMFAVDDEQPDWLCKDCRDTQDEAFPPPVEEK